MSIEAWLGFVLICVWGASFMFLKYREAAREIAERKNYKSAADYTLMIEYIPCTMTREELERQINEQLLRMHDDGDLEGNFRMAKLIKLNIAKPYYEYEAHFATEGYLSKKEEMEEVRERVIELVKERKEHFKFVTPRAERMEIYADFARRRRNLIKEAEHLVGEIREDIEKDDDARDISTTTGFATFESNDTRN